MLLAEDDRADAGEPSARAAGQGQLAVGHLRFAALAAQLPRRLDEQEDAAHAGMARAEAAAVGVQRELVAERQRAALHESAALALGAEAEVFEHQQGSDGETVIELD